MKKFLLVVLIIVLIILLCFSIKSLLDVYSEEKKDQNEKESTVEDYLEKGWEIEAEYNYNGTVTENEIQYFQNTESVE